MNNQEQHKKDVKRVFSINSILSQVINWAAYIILFGSVLILLYFSLMESINFTVDWRTLGIFAGAAVLLSWVNWNNFYKQRFEKIMADDISQQELGKYSIHGRYYNAIKDYNDIDLQKAIDKFNDEYTAKWLRWVERITGVPIETCMKVEINEITKQPVLDENGKPKLIEVKGIKDLPYKGFKHKLLMWRIKHHVYPQSGYKSSMELMSLFSYQDANLNKRHLKADRSFYAKHSIRRLITSALSITMTGSIIPTMLQGNIWEAILRILIALCTLGGAVLMGSVSGVRGARIKLSIVEDACVDLEQWRNKKPLLAPYTVVEDNKKELEVPDAIVVENQNEQHIEISENIFNKIKPNLPNE